MSARPRRERALLLTAVALLLFAAGVPLTTTAAARVAVSIGATGLPGTLRVTHCVRADRVAYCSGTFTSDDAKVTDPYATVAADRDPGDLVIVRRTAPGTYALGGAAAALGWTAVTFIGLGAIVAGLLGLAVQRRWTALAPPLRRLLGLLCAAVLACAVASVLGELAAAV